MRLRQTVLNKRGIKTAGVLTSWLGGWSALVLNTCHQVTKKRLCPESPPGMSKCWRKAKAFRVWVDSARRFGEAERKVGKAKISLSSGDNLRVSLIVSGRYKARMGHLGV